MNHTDKKLHQLVFPLFLEILFTMLAGIVDTLMLSTVGDQAVGAVGTATTYINVFIIMFTIISSGMMAVMTQYIGANRPGVAKITLKIGLIFNLILGLLFSLIMFFRGEWLLLTIGIAPNLLAPATTYLQVVGGFCFFSALIPIFSSYLRSFGHPGPTMVGTIVGNAVNLLLNTLFLFVFHWGVFGVALATSISRAVNLLWVFIASTRRIHVEADPNPPPTKALFSSIIRIGLPAALESAMYNLAMTLVIRYLNQMDADGTQATARSYAAQISHFSYSISFALGQANAIMCGWRIGHGDLVTCNRETHRATIYGIVSNFTVSVLLAVFAAPILRLFTDDPMIIRLVQTLLIVDIVLEIGRAASLVYGMALKTSGDAVYPMIIAVLFGFLFAAGGTWFFGLRLGWLAVGAYVGMTLDECTRAVLMFRRWCRGNWKKHMLVD